LTHARTWRVRVQELFHRTARTVAQGYYGTLRFVSLDVVTELLPVEALESLDRLPAVLLYRAGEKSSPRIFTAPWRTSENLQVRATVWSVRRVCDECACWTEFRHILRRAVA